jgi:hypothetical protein
MIGRRNTDKVREHWKKWVWVVTGIESAQNTYGRGCQDNIIKGRVLKDVGNGRK